MKHKWLWSLALCLMFLGGTVSGFLLSGSPVRAEQKFGPEDVQSVPDDFVLGGNKQFAILRDLLTATLENQKRLEAIEQNTAAMVSLMQRGNATAPSVPSPPPPRTAPQRPQ